MIRTWPDDDGLDGAEGCAAAATTVVNDSCVSPASHSPKYNARYIPMYSLSNIGI